MQISKVLSTLIILFAIQSAVQADSPTLRLGISGNFRADGFVVTNVQPNSPSTRMDDRSGLVGSIEQNDVITSIDGVIPTTHDVLASTLNKSVSGELQIDVRDRRSGNVKRWTVHAVPTAISRFGIARDTYLRELRATRDREQGVEQIVSIHGNSATNMMSLYLPTIDPRYPSPYSSVELVADMTKAMAGFKDCVIAHPNPIWVNQELLSKVDALIEPNYAKFLDPQLSEQKRLVIARELCTSVQKTLEHSFDDWLEKSGYEEGMAAAAPAGIPFLAKAERAGTLVELISRADMILTLLQNGEALNPLSPKARTVLDGAIHWRRLPSDGYASAYGNYFYRLVAPQPNGTLMPQPFDPNRKFTIREQPESEEIVFK